MTISLSISGNSYGSDSDDEDSSDDEGWVSDGAYSDDEIGNVTGLIYFFAILTIICCPFYGKTHRG